MPAHAADPGPADLTVTTDVLEHVEPDRLDAVLTHLRDRTRFKCYAVISLKSDRSKALPDVSNPHRLVRPFAWWRETLGRYFWVDAARESANGAEAVFHMRPRWDAITVVTFLWQGRPGMEAYGPEHVNTMARMVARHLKMPHRFVCITDRADGIEAETLPLWPEIARPVPPKRLSCYRRLKLFAADAGDWLGRTTGHVGLRSIKGATCSRSEGDDGHDYNNHHRDDAPDYNAAAPRQPQKGPIRTPLITRRSAGVPRVTPIGSHPMILDQI